MFRRVIAGLILGPALLIGSFAWTGYLALQTVFDENRSETIARELLENPEVRAQVAANLGSAIERALPPEVPISGDQVDAAALTILDDPRVTEVIVRAFGSTHRAFLGQGDAPENIDLEPLASVAREQVARFAPSAAESIAVDADWTIALPTERIPDASPVKRFLETAVPPLAGISLLMVMLAFLTTSDRPSVLRRAARWAIGTTVVYLLLGLGVPALLRAWAPEQTEVIAALLTAVLRSTLVPSIVLGGSGLALLLASWVWPRGERPSARSSAPAPPRPAPPTAGPSTGTRRPAAVTTPAAATEATAWSPPVDTFEPSPPGSPPPTTHVPPARPQRSAPPQQPVTPPSTPAVPAQTAPPPPTPRPPVFDPFATPDPIVTGGGGPSTPPAEPPPFRPTLPTRAAPADRVSLPAWTGDLQPTPDGGTTRSRPPRWVDGHGWVLDPHDERPVPDNARYVEGVGYVVPGPPPRRH